MTGSHAIARALIVEWGPLLVAIVALGIKLTYVGGLLGCCEPGWIVTTTSVTLLTMAAPALFLPRVLRYLAALGFDLAVTTLVLADLVHAHFYGDVGSIFELHDAWQLPSVSASIVAALKPAHVLLYVDVALGAALFPLYLRGCRAAPPSARRRVRWLFAGLLAASVVLAVPAVHLMLEDPQGIFRFAIGRRQVVAAIGILPYHLYDGITYLRYPLWGRLSVGEVERREVLHFLESTRRGDLRVSALRGKAAGRNLVVIQAEALHTFLLGLKAGGRAVTPHLSAFARESLHFVNFYDQTWSGATADAVFISQQSLHPLAIGAVATRYPTNRYRGMPAILAGEGYRTLAAMGASGQYWNLRILLGRLGFQVLHLDGSYRGGHWFGQGLADGDFFAQTLEFLRYAQEPFFAFLITVSGHHPYDLPTQYRSLELGDLEGTIVGNYLHSMHYFDQEFGAFIGALRRSGLLDRSVVAVYGDHQAWLREAPELARLLGFAPDDDFRRWEVNARVPLIVRLPDGEAAGAWSNTGGHLDIAPTLLSLLGSRGSDRLMLGRDLTAGRDSLVVFRDGSFATAGHYLVRRLGKLAGPDCREAETARRTDCAQLDELRQEAERRLKVSDDIIRGDLLPDLGAALDESARP